MLRFVAVPLKYIIQKSEVGRQTFFKSANPLSQIRKFIWRVSPFAKNQQIFMINPQISKFQQNTVQLCLKMVLKVVYFFNFLIFYKFELERYSYRISREKYGLCFCGSFKSAKKLGSANRNFANDKSANKKILCP